MFQLCPVIQKPRNSTQRREDEGRLLVTENEKRDRTYATQYRCDQPKLLHLMLTGKVKSIEPGA